MSVLVELVQITPPDGGVWYAETHLEHTLVEPWNAFSSLAFLIPVIYWAFRLKGRYQQNRFLTGCMPLLALGGIGSTVYHAFRNSQYFLMMDVLPITLLTLAVSLYIWWKVLPHWSYVAILGVFILGLRFLTSKLLSGQHAINISYTIIGVMMFLPALILLFKTAYRGLLVISMATLFFIISLIFRKIDAPFAFLPMGTHWLWHICCTIGVFFLAEYLYIINNILPYRESNALDPELSQEQMTQKIQNAS
jgi:hemolysin III